MDIAGAELRPADAVLSIAAHSSRALLLTEWLDPSIRDESDPDDRDPMLDLYAQPSDQAFSADFLAAYRAAQTARMARITTRALEVLERLRSSGGLEAERVFVTHRTMADPRFLDPRIDPNGRKPGWSYLGKPEVVNSGPVGLGRVSTLRSWLSQWSPAHSRADSLVTGKAISVPFLALECSADDAVPQPHTGHIFAAVASQDKTMRVVPEANHYFVGQPRELAAATTLVSDWLAARDFG